MSHLFFGDNLHVMRESIADASVDLVYLDPPFNSKRDYNLLFKSPEGSESHAQITAFEDSWHWGEQAEREYGEILQSGHTRMADLISAFRGFLGENDLMAYLVMMANRLLELHRVLKPTGSLYLHCDPTASHYLKLVLDAVLGVENFQNEIVWKRVQTVKGNFGQGSKFFAPNTDSILFYSKSRHQVFHQSFQEYSDGYVDGFFKYKDTDGRRYRLISMIGPGGASKGNPHYEILGVTRYWRYSKERMAKLLDDRMIIQTKPGAVPQRKQYLDTGKGVPVQSLWDDIPPASGREYLGYPTQKPVALLERILNASSNPGDVVLDPFCGCGTAVHAAQKLGRNWIGIDITHLAISLIEKRLKDAFPGIKFEVHGTPKDLAGARDLALRDKYQFQWWACSLVDAQPFQGKKKGVDGGIDGLIYFADVVGGKAATQRLVVSVKGGSVSVPQVRDLKGVLDREKAPIGLFVTLEKPTKPMRVEAASAGFYKGGNGKEYPRLQILTLAELLEGHKRPEFPDLSMGSYTFKKAKRERLDMAAETPNLFED